MAVKKMSPQFLHTVFCSHCHGFKFLVHKSIDKMLCIQLRPCISVNYKTIRYKCYFQHCSNISDCHICGKAARGVGGFHGPEGVGGTKHILKMAQKMTFFKFLGRPPLQACGPP